MASARLWWLRYPLGGGHLKIRFHSQNADLAEATRGRLIKVCEPFLADLPAITSPRRVTEAPAIDSEDEAAANNGRGPDPPPRLVFPSYRRSSVSLGADPLLNDDDVVGLLVETLAVGCQQLVAGWRHPMTLGRRRRLLLELLIDGLGGLMPDGDSAAAYLAYHRDWLIRALLVRTGAAGPDEAEWLSRLESHTAASGLNGILDESSFEWRNPEELQSWPGALARLRDLVEHRYPAERFDPFATAAYFTPMFKALHGIANALGTSRPEEALAYHLAWKAITDA